ncbi:hypothetical protein DFQ26_000747 [Actinomortierella ambigua]|nr:hypothetical protein DFQ26_000747 [Actinomortierella ambigua]
MTSTSVCPTPTKTECPLHDLMEDLTTTTVSSLSLQVSGDKNGLDLQDASHTNNTASDNTPSPSPVVEDTSDSIKRARTPFEVSHLVDKIFSHLTKKEMWSCSLINTTCYDAVRRTPMQTLALHTRPLKDVKDCVPHLIHMALSLILHVEYLKLPTTNRSTKDHHACVSCAEFMDAAGTEESLSAPEALWLRPLSPGALLFPSCKDQEPAPKINRRSSHEEDEETVVGLRCRQKSIVEVKLSTLCEWLSKAKRVKTLELIWLSNHEQGGRAMRRIIHSVPNVSTLTLDIRRLQALYYFVDSLRCKKSLVNLRLYARGLWRAEWFAAIRSFSRRRRLRQQDDKNLNGSSTSGAHLPLPPECSSIRAIYVHKPIPLTQDHWLDFLSYFPCLTDTQITLPPNLRPGFGHDLVQSCPRLVALAGSDYEMDVLQVMQPVMEKLVRFNPHFWAASDQSIEFLQKHCSQMEEWKISTTQGSAHHQSSMSSRAMQKFLVSPTAEKFKILRIEVLNFDGLAPADVYDGTTLSSKGWTCLQLRELGIKVQYLSRFAHPPPPVTTTTTTTTATVQTGGSSAAGDQSRLIYLRGFYQQITRLQDLEVLHLRGQIDVEEMVATGLDQLAQLKKLRSLDLTLSTKLTPTFLLWVLSTWSKTLEHLVLQHGGLSFVCEKEGTLPNMKDFHRIEPVADGKEPDWYKHIGSKSLKAMFPRKK